MIDSSGFVSLEWQQWLLNPQFLSLSVDGQQVPSQGGAGGQVVPVFFEEADEGEQGIPGVKGDKGDTGLSGARPFDGADGEDGLTIVGPQGVPGQAAPLAMLFMEGEPGADAMVIPGPAGASGSASITDPLSQAYAPGSFTVADGKYAVMSRHLQLTSTQRATLAGTATLRIT